VSNADREDVHLPAGIVDVVLAVHAEAGRVEQVGERGLKAACRDRRSGAVGLDTN
jgi:hypothetical protein